METTLVNSANEVVPVLPINDGVKRLFVGNVADYLTKLANGMVEKEIKIERFKLDESFFCSVTITKMKTKAKFAFVCVKPKNGLPVVESKVSDSDNLDELAKFAHICGIRELSSKITEIQYAKLSEIVLGAGISALKAEFGESEEKLTNFSKSKAATLSLRRRELSSFTKEERQKEKDAAELKRREAARKQIAAKAVHSAPVNEKKDGKKVTQNRK